MRQLGKLILSTEWVSLSRVNPSKLFDFWNEGNVIIWGLQLGVGKIIWGLKFRGLKGAICSLQFGVREIIWSLTFLVCHCPRHFLSTPFFRNWTADDLGSLKKLVSLFGGLRKLLDTSTPVPKIKEPPWQSGSQTSKIRGIVKMRIYEVF